MTQPLDRTTVQRQEIDLPADAPDSFSIFQTVVRPMFDVVRLRQDEPFFARSSITFLPDMLFSRAANSAVRFERTRRTIARSGIDDILVLVYLGGAFACETQGVARVVPAHRVAFFDLKMPFSIESQRVDNFSVIVSRHRLAELVPRLDGVHGLVLHESATTGLLLAHLHACDRMAHRIPTEESPGISAVTLQSIAAALQSARRQAAGPAARSGITSLSDITESIEHMLGRADLGPVLLTEAFGISRASLYRLFEPSGGVGAFILERRLSRALKAITALHPTHVSLKQLAHDLGFGHPTSFSRAFRKRFGLSPQEVRAMRAYPDEIQPAAWRKALADSQPSLAPHGTRRAGPAPAASAAAGTKVTQT